MFLEEKGGYGSTQPGWVDHRRNFDLTKERKEPNSSDSEKEETKEVNLLGEEITSKKEAHNSKKQLVDEIDNLFSGQSKINLNPAMIEHNKSSHKSNVDLLSMTDLFSASSSSNSNVNNINVDLLYDFTKK